MQMTEGKAPVDITNYNSGMRNWFKENLPFKILKSGMSGIDTDNAFNGVGITMGWDSRFNRLFLTKKDYIPLSNCLEYIEGRGFFLNNTSCGEPALTSCPEGYTLDELNNTCVRNYETEPLCPAGYIYNKATKQCVLTEVDTPNCICEADVIASGETICGGATTSIELTSVFPGTGYRWTVAQSGVTGATSGTGTTIAQVLTPTGFTQGSASYTITPYEIVDGCSGTPINVIVTVKPIPDVIATPSSLNITEGETATINLTSSLAGTTFIWTVAQLGTTGATSGSGNTISQVINGTGTATYTITPVNNGCTGTAINVEVSTATLVLDNNTQVNIWFDDSGSMDTTLSPLQFMASNILKNCLLPAYNNDSALYDSRVKVLNFGNASNLERYINLLSSTSSDPSVTRVINLTFADESNNYNAELSGGTTITTMAAEDINLLRTKLESSPANSLVGVAFQVATGGVTSQTYPGFRTFMTNVHTGVTPFTSTQGLSDKAEIGYKLDVIPGSSPEYYANLIVEALNSIGFNLTPC
jgi:hypothetical protein